MLMPCAMTFTRWLTACQPIIGLVLAICFAYAFDHSCPPRAGLMQGWADAGVGWVGSRVGGAREGSIGAL